MIQLRKVFGVLICILFAALCHAQAVKGTVKDTTGKWLPYVTVNLKNNISNLVVAYTVSDSKGNFVLQVPANIAAASVTVEARALGYITAVKNITGFDTPVEFILAAAIDPLPEVVVKSERPVLRTHGDTLSYKVSEFANPQDRTIGEVIKKLPGITVDANGTIRYNNKPVSTVYLGGDNLLDDKYSIATNTIPQGVVSKVQVIENNQPIKILQNKVLSDDVALNLEFKKDAKLQLIGQETIGAGLPGNYDVDLNVMMFKNKYKAINYFKGNNTGNDLQRELVSHNLSSYMQWVDNAVPATVLSLGTVNMPALERNRYLFNQAGVLNLNNMVTLKKDVQLKVNAYYLHDTQQQDYAQRTNTFLPGDTVVYNEVQHNRLVSDALHAQFTLHINREKYYLNDVLQMHHQNNDWSSGLRTDSSVLNQSFKDHLCNFSNELNFIRSLRSNHIIQAHSYISHSTEPENRVIDPGYNEAIFNDNLPYAQLVQSVNIPSWYTHNYIAFKIPSKLVTQSLRTGFSVQSQTLASELAVVQNNNNINLKDSALNHLNWTKKKLYAEATYDLPGPVLQANLSLPVTLQQIDYADGFCALNKDLKRLYFNPQLIAKYKLGAEDYLNFLYYYRNQIGTIVNVYPGYILTDYRTLTANSGEITEQSSQQVSGGYSHRQALKLFFWSINVMYDHSHANNIASNVITNNMQKSVVLPYPNSSDSWMLNGTISKYSFALRTTFSAVVQWQTNRSVQIQNNVLLPFNTKTGIFNISANAKISDRINADYKITLTQTNSHSAADISVNQVNQLLQQASVNYDPVDKLQFRLSAEHYFTRRKGQQDLQYFFADASLKYKANKWKTDFELSAVNFLDVKTYSAFYLSANTLAASSYKLPGRIVMVKIRFNLQ